MPASCSLSGFDTVCLEDWTSHIACRHNLDHVVCEFKTAFSEIQVVAFLFTSVSGYFKFKYIIFHFILMKFLKLRHKMLLLDNHFYFYHSGHTLFLSMGTE